MRFTSATVRKVRFTPVGAADTRTYRFEAKLTLGRILGATRQNNGDVPDGIGPLLRQPFRVVFTVKQAA
jgi:hypothetical protein